jgi:hypothetical protein
MTQESILFKIDSLATIKALNIRKEGEDDEKIVAVDVKLEFKKVDRRLCAYFDSAIEEFLWRGETDALMVRNAFLKPLAYVNSIKDATIVIGTHEYSGCDVGKFQIEPQDGGVITLTCSATVNPNEADIADLAKAVQDDTQVSIEGPPDLFARAIPTDLVRLKG